MPIRTRRVETEHIVDGAITAAKEYRTTEDKTCYVKPKTGDASQTKGSGLNDLTAGTATYGYNYNGEENSSYYVKISSVGTPDKFQWKKNDNKWSAEIDVDNLSYQELDEQVYINFAANTGHTLGDEWTIPCQGSTSSNNGSTSAKAFNTVQAAIDGLPKVILHTTTISLEDGLNYFEQINIAAFRGSGKILVKGSSDDADKVLITYSADFPIVLQVNNCNCNIEAKRISLKAWANVAGWCFSATACSYVYYHRAKFAGRFSEGISAKSSSVIVRFLSDYDAANKCSFGLSAYSAGFIGIEGSAEFGTTFFSTFAGGLIIDRFTCTTITSAPPVVGYNFDIKIYSNGGVRRIYLCDSSNWKYVSVAT